MSELLVFDGESLEGPIACEDLGLLRSVTMRGENLVIDGVAGTQPFALLPHELNETLTWFVTGLTDWTGSVNADPETGVEENMEHYRALFTSGGDSETGLHTVALHYAGTVFVGGMQVAEYAQTRTGHKTATLLTRVRIPATELTESGSA